MDEDDPLSVCAIHFEGEDNKDIRVVTDITLKRIIERRKQWLDLSGSYNNFSSVAVNSFEFIPADVHNVDQLPRKCFYHIKCYRNFTDITKIERANKTLANVTKKRNGSEDIDAVVEDAPPEKIVRTTRQSLIANDKEHERSSSNILPKRCLICKIYGPIYVSDSVVSF